jgi:NAD(P)-dependent dehydrogenase (short-subunit alcohol dehydrogenase family)
MGARSQTKAENAIASIREQVPNADIQVLIMDHMSLESIVAAARSFISKEPSLHGLINNAGIMAVPWELSQDGYESQWQTNYLSHWLLTFHLLPILRRTAEEAKEPGVARIVSVSSMGHTFAPKTGIDFLDLDQKSGSPYSRYGVSKLGNILHAKEIDRRYGPRGECTKGAEGIWVAAVHPGNSPT